MFILICIMLCQCNRGIIVKDRMENKALDPGTSSEIVDATSKLLTSLNIAESLRDFVELILTPVRVPSRHIIRKMKGKNKSVPKLFDEINKKDIDKIKKILNNDKKRIEINLNLNKKIELKDGAYTYFIHMMTEQLEGNAIKHIIEKDVNINEEDSEGKTPLIIATEKGDKRAVEILIEAGANVNKKRKDGMSPIHIAILEKHNSLVEVLIEGGASYKTLSKENVMPIHYACLTGNIEAAKTILIKAEKDHINEEDSKGRTAIHYAAASGQKGMIEFVKREGGKYKTDKYGATPLHYAVINNTIEEIIEDKKELLIEIPTKNVNMIDEIIHLYKDEEKYYEDNYSTVVVTGDPTAASSIASSTESLEGKPKEEAALMQSISEPILTELTSENEEDLSKTKDIKILEMILHKEKNGFTPFHYGGMLGDKETIKELYKYLETYVNKNKDIRNFKNNFKTKLIESWRSKKVEEEEISEASPLDLACYYNNIEVIEYLADQEKLFYLDGINPFYEINKKINSPLHYAAMKGNEASIQKVLESLNKVDKIEFINHKNANGYTYKQLYEKTLSEKGQKREKKEYEEEYKLHNSVENNDFISVENLLNKGDDDINKKTALGITAMHIASELGYYNILKLIYKKESIKGTKIISHLDDNRNNEAHYAAKNSNNECMKLIVEYIPESLNIKNREGNTPLHIAVQEKNDIQSAILVGKDVDVNIQNNELMTALILATEILDKEKRDKIIDILLSSEIIDLSVQDTNGSTAIEYLYNIDDYRNVKLLLTKGASLNIKGKNKLTLPMKVINDNNDNNSSASLILRDEKVNIEKRFPNGDTLLYRAVKNKNEAFVRYLLEREDISKIIGKKSGQYFNKTIFGKGKSAFSLAMEEDENSNIVGLFLQYGINVNQKKGIFRRTLLHKSMKENKLEITKELLKSRKGRKNINKALKTSKLNATNLIVLALELGEVSLAKKAYEKDETKGEFIFEKHILAKIVKSKNKELVTFLLTKLSDLFEIRSESDNQSKLEINIIKGEEIRINIEENAESNEENIEMLKKYFTLRSELHLEGESTNKNLVWKKGFITISIEQGTIIIKADNDEEMSNNETMKFFFKNIPAFEINFHLLITHQSEV